jgi:alpha-mannosidase
VALHWVAVTGSRAGLAVLNAGTPGNTADDGILMLTLFRSAAMEYKAPSTSGFQEGIPHVFRYAILPHRSASEAEVVRHGHAFNQPSLVLRAQPKWIEKNGWRVDGDASVMVSSLRCAGDDVFIRIYECAGREAQATLRVPKRFKRWAKADGLQKAVGDSENLGSGGLPLQLRPFEIRNLLLSVKT